MSQNKNRKRLVYLLFLIALLLGSFVIYTISSATSGYNKLKVSYAKLTSIQTGTGTFDDNDGFSYEVDNSTNYSEINGYIPGKDANDKNRIVRSFDTLTYNFDFKIEAKSGNQDEDYENRSVQITVDLNENEAKYISFSKDSATGELSHTFVFEGIDTYDIFNRSLVLYVHGAPNGMEIAPKFTIKETEDEDNQTVLGNVGSDSYNYKFDGVYTNIADFNNYLPTVVSSTDTGISFVLTKNNDEENQKAVYDNDNGRYITYVLGIKLDNPNNNMKGLTLPSDAINFNVNFSSTGNKQVIFNENWGRMYGSQNIDNINSIRVNVPYSDSNSGRNNNRIANPGNVEVTKVSDNNYSVKVSDIASSFRYPNVGADDNEFDSSNIYISTLSFSTFSPRTREDGRNDINNTILVNNGSTKNVSGNSINIPDASLSSVNKFYEESDYSLTGAFYDASGLNKISKDEVVNGTVCKNGTGSVSKGTTLQFKTEFNYKKTLSDQGLKEVIKIDSNAFRFIPIDDNNDFDIELKCGNETCSGISKEDFEVKFISGSFDNTNYSANDISSLKLSDDDKNAANSACSGVVNNLSSYNVNQIQNLYGGPCIKANDGVEEEYTNITSAVDENNNEVKLTKVVIQTREGVVLPDNVVVTMKVNVRVRNVTDITQGYQATVVASTSDYDSNLYYYSPTISNDENNVCNPDNYVKTTYSGKTPTSCDTSLFGDTIRVVNFTSREEITVKNKNSDGSMKTNFNTAENETIVYNVKTTIEDNNEAVGADDTWYINSLVVTVNIPEKLNYIEDADLIKPAQVYKNELNNDTVLVYVLPYTKPNMKIQDIEFKTKLDPTLIGNSIPIEVTSHVQAKNINGEEDNSITGALYASFKIYATGMESIIVEQKVGEQGTVVEKNSEFSYLLNAYNNTNSDVDNYSILDILPFQGDDNKSQFNGSYKVKVTMPSNLSQAKVYCSKDLPSKLRNEVFDKDNNFEECDITEDYIDKVTAIRIDDIYIKKSEHMGDIKISIVPTNNKYSDTYNNRFKGSTPTGYENTSNKISVKVVSRKISGRVFIDTSGDGVKDGKEVYVENVAATLYSLDNENNLTEVARTTTNKDGYYEFKDLDVGRYKVRFYDYDSGKYDLTLRYATEDTAKDSDAYKINDNGDAEISNKRVPDDPNGIRLTRAITSAENMDMGLIPRQSFGFSMRKYITKIDLSYNGSLNTTNYDNQSSVSINVRNSQRATAKVYYGISITNNSTRAGYVNLVQEDIPSGMIFDANYEENKDWFEVNGVLQTDVLKDELIKPGETKYLQIVLFMPSREEAGTFLNSVSIIDSEMYDPTKLVDDASYSNNDRFVIGDELTYAGVNWHVIKATDSDNAQVLTLLADSGTVSINLGHTNAAGDIYKWSESNINRFINSNYEWLNVNTLDPSVLYDQVVCDDASGLENGSYGGTMSGICQSGQYVTTKIRLLTLEEYTSLKESSISDLSWLNGSNSFWLQNSDYVSPEYLQRYINAYNNSYNNKEHTGEYDDVNYGILQNSVHDKAMYIDYGSSTNLTTSANTKMEVRPVITISTNNIVAE